MKRKTNTEMSLMREVRKTPKLKKDISKYLDIYKLQDTKGAKQMIFGRINFDSFLFNFYLAQKHKKNCMVIDSKNKTFQLYFTSSGLLLSMPFDKKTLFFENIKSCKKNNSTVLIPLCLVRFKLKYIFNIQKFLTGHQNMIIYNKYFNTFEHYEPHGHMTQWSKKEKKRNKLSKKLQKSLKKFFEDQTIIPGAKYVPPSSACPVLSKRGIQDIGEEMWVKLEMLTGDIEKGQIRKRRGVGITTKRTGLCMVWSYFLADLRLQFPKVEIERLMKNIFDKLNEDPSILISYAHKFIRFSNRTFGMYFKEIEKKYKFDPELFFILMTTGLINDVKKIKLGKNVSKKKEEEFIKEVKKIRKNKKAYEEKIISFLFSKMKSFKK